MKWRDTADSSAATAATAATAAATRPNLPVADFYHPTVPSDSPDRRITDSWLMTKISQRHHVNRLILFVTLLVVGMGIGAGACKSGESAVADDDHGSSREGTATAPEDFTMIFGEGGGFTGRWEGYAIQSDGAVLAWSGPTAGEESTPVGSLTAAQMDDLWAQVQDAEFFDQNVRETGNITAFIEVTAGQRKHRVSWIPGAEGFEPPRSAIDALYRQSLQVAGGAAE